MGKTMDIFSHFIWFITSFLTFQSEINFTSLFNCFSNFLCILLILLHACFICMLIILHVCMCFSPFYTQSRKKFLSQLRRKHHLCSLKGQVSILLSITVVHRSVYCLQCSLIIVFYAYIYFLLEKFQLNKFQFLK